VPITTQLLQPVITSKKLVILPQKTPSFPTVYFMITKQAIFQQKRQSRIQINPNCVGFQQQEVNRNTLTLP